MIDLSSIKNYYIACGYTDLRRGIDGLAQIVILQYGYEINENSLFLFCGRRTDRIKALWFSGDGFVLLYKPSLSVVDGRPFCRAEKSHQKGKKQRPVLVKTIL